MIAEMKRLGPKMSPRPSTGVRLESIERRRSPCDEWRSLRDRECSIRRKMLRSTSAHATLTSEGRRWAYGRDRARRAAGYGTRCSGRDYRRGCVVHRAIAAQCSALSGHRANSCAILTEFRRTRSGKLALRGCRVGAHRSMQMRRRAGSADLIMDPRGVEGMTNAAGAYRALASTSSGASEARRCSPPGLPGRPVAPRSITAIIEGRTAAE